MLKGQEGVVTITAAPNLIWAGLFAHAQRFTQGFTEIPLKRCGTNEPALESLRNRAKPRIAQKKSPTQVTNKKITKMWVKQYNLLDFLWKWSHFKYSISIAHKPWIQAGFLLWGMKLIPLQLQWLREGWNYPVVSAGWNHWQENNSYTIQHHQLPHPTARADVLTSWMRGAHSSWSSESLVAPYTSPRVWRQSTLQLNQHTKQADICLRGRRVGL